MADNHVQDDARERKAAEIEFVTSAYSPEEAWASPPSKKNSSRRIHRRLFLEDDDIGGVEVELTLTLPDDYLETEDVVLSVDAAVVDARQNPHPRKDSNNNTRKNALDALPHLLEACRSEALDRAGEEAVFSVLSRADMWIEEDWKHFREKAVKNDDEPEPTVTTRRDEVLGRRVIYSHHIIANSKRKAIVELASCYNLGGYAKIGWPGVIILEGREEDCISYIEEMKRMRWQYLTVRGEEQIPVGSDAGDLDKARVLPKKFVELGKHQMSDLAAICREAGLEDLFLTCMKIYKDSDDNDKKGGDDETLDTNPVDESCHYGILIFVDHMNDSRNYRKWLQKVTKSVGCSLSVFPVGGNELRPSYIVCLVGEEADAKRVMKRWRTSRVDVDRKGIPCLERQMTVLIEGAVESRAFLETIECHIDDNSIVNNIDLHDTILQIGGPSWTEALKSVIPNN